MLHGPRTHRWLKKKRTFTWLQSPSQLQGLRQWCSASHQLLQQIVSRAPVVKYIVPAPVVIGHDGPDAIPRSQAAGTGASAADHGIDAADAAAGATDAASGTTGASGGDAARCNPEC